MEYRNLGRSGVKVSPLCLGTMNFGGPTDEAAAGRIVAKARGQGVNFIDSADAYQGGQSEEIVDRPIVSQPYYHALYRVMEVEHLPACANYGLGVVSYSPLARGVLTGKYRPGAEAPKDTRAGRADKRMLQTEFRKETLEAAQKFK